MFSGKSTSKRERTETNRKAMVLAIIAGILLLISGLSGVAAWEEIKEIVNEEVSDDEMVQMAFAGIILIASLGGIAVIIGGVLIGKSKVRSGRLVIAIGVGTGLIGLLVSLYVTIMDGSFTLGAFLGVGAFGLLLSIVARMMAKKEKI